MLKIGEWRDTIFFRIVEEEFTFTMSGSDKSRKKKKDLSDWSDKWINRVVIRRVEYVQEYK